MDLVRKVTRAKWSSSELGEGEIPADAISVDLRTSGNTLSLWESPSPGELHEVVLALAAAGDRIDKIDVVFIDRQRIDDLGIELSRTPGDTPVLDLVSRHVDATRLDMVRLGSFASELSRALRAEQHRRWSKKHVAKIVAAAVDAGRVAFESLGAKVQEEVSKYSTRVSDQEPKK